MALPFWDCHFGIATRAELGWIGKNCLLVTEKFGSAIRLSSLLTQVPLCCEEPVNRPTAEPAESV